MSSACLLFRVAKKAPMSDEALEALQFTAKTEGILPAMESSHALAYAIKRARELRPDKAIVVCLSGRGDKDVNEVARLMGREI